MVSNLFPITTSSQPSELSSSSKEIPDISLPARLEAILYLKGKPMRLEEIIEYVNEEKEIVEQALFALTAEYAQRDTALEINERNGTYSLQLRAGLGELVQNLLPVDISVATLRTLATIALKKRILQSDLVDIRGSGVYEHIKELVSQKFIDRKRQREGRSYWLTLSEKFHQTFTILPDIKSEKDGKAA